MSGPETERRRAEKAERRERRREVERCLTQWGLVRGPRRLRLGTPPIDPKEGGFSGRLRTVFESLGPVFSSFGIYLSSRVDLFTVGDCLELAGTAPPAPWPIEAVHERITAELGRDPGEIFDFFDDKPLAARLTVQLHRALLRGGHKVVVWVVPMGVEEIERDLELLSLLVAAFTARGWGAPQIEDAIADFRRTLDTQANLRAAVEALRLLGDDAETFGVLRVPQIDRHLSTSGVLTLEDLGGVSLEETGRTAGVMPLRPDRALARRLAVVWLRQALNGQVFPLAPGEAEIAILGDGRVDFRGGRLEKPPDTFRRNMLEYLIAVALHQPDDACTYLVREMTQDDQADFNQLRMRLRQVMPFRDGAWSRDGESLAEHLFVHARLARSLGYRPGFHLLAFYRGLFSIAAIARRLAPEQDVLREALEDVRLYASLAQMRDVMSFSTWGQQLERYAQLAAQMPQKLDEVLTLAAQGHARSRGSVAAPRTERRRHATSAVVALLLALVAVVLAVRHMMSVGFAEPWAERIGAAFFIVFGALLLRQVGRMSRGVRR